MFCTLFAYLVLRFSLSLCPGSPFVLRIGEPPDASKVRVFGPGVEHGILHTFESMFLVETHGAGAGQLAVRVRGPRGMDISVDVTFGLTKF